jgi:hypothetical protein
MSKCGPCPQKKNEKFVHLSLSDLMLCIACKNVRFPAAVTNTNAKAAHTSTMSSSVEMQPVERHDGTQLGGCNVAENTVTEPVGSAWNTTSMPASSTGRQSDTKIEIDEL